MPNIFHQSVEDILKAATPEQKILWNYIFLQYGERVSVSQFYFCGAGGGELATYVARKMYLAYELELSNDLNSVNLAGSYLYNEANSAFFQMKNISAYWDVTAAALRGITNNVKTKNIIFSRLAIASYAFVLFKGYRVIY